jgi:hypothetical protein
MLIFPLVPRVLKVVLHRHLELAGKVVLALCTLVNKPELRRVHIAVIVNPVIHRHIENIVRLNAQLQGVLLANLPIFREVNVDLRKGGSAEPGIA